MGVHGKFFPLQGVRGAKKVENPCHILYYSSIISFKFALKTKDVSQSCTDEGVLWQGETLDIHDKRINF